MKSQYELARDEAGEKYGQENWRIAKSRTCFVDGFDAGREYELKRAAKLVNALMSIRSDLGNEPYHSIALCKNLINEVLAEIEDVK